jgi:hypothetical protein
VFGFCALVYFFLLLRTTAATAITTITTAAAVAIRYQLTEAGVAEGACVGEGEIDVASEGEADVGVEDEIDVAVEGEATGDGDGLVGDINRASPKQYKLQSVLATYRKPL